MLEVEKGGLRKGDGEPGRGRKLRESKRRGRGMETEAYDGWKGTKNGEER